MIQEKTRDTVLEIDLTKMADNLEFIRSKLKPSTKIMAVVKAFAYGSGNDIVARFLEDSNVDYLAVAYTDEGVALRQDGITLPILVLNPSISSFNAMIQHNLEPQLASLRLINEFIEALNENQIGDGTYPVHIKINTGMNRLGFDTWQLDTLGQLLDQNKILNVVSVYSHLSGSDDPEMDSFTETQVIRFKVAVEILDQHLQKPYLKHILNSNGILRHEKHQMDMVRLGIALYGVSSNPETSKLLKPVSCLKTIITQIRDVAKEEGIGYSPEALESEGLIIAVIPIGYADGLPRALGNRVGSVSINGQRAKIVGNICMDMCMVEVTHIHCLEGDSVEIFGENISIYEIANLLNTIPYEVLTNISQRVKRVSIQS